MTALILYDHPASICSQMARLALAEKGVAYTRQTIDIMEKAEQFEPWYVALNPNAVVPTLAHGETIVTDTKRIVAYVDAHCEGPALTPPDPAPMRAWMDEIMGLHYGVLLYSRRLTPEGTAPTIIERGDFLRRLRAARPEHAELLDKRIAGNTRFQEILADPVRVKHHIGCARSLVERMAEALETREFIAADTYSLADCFATAALARFRLHGYAGWWQGGPVAEYFDRMRARPSYAAAAVVDSGSERAL